jgi:hypothetical protein
VEGEMVVKTKVTTNNRVWIGTDRKVVFGKLKRGKGHPGKVSHLFKCIGEKLPFEALENVRDALKRELDKETNELKGVYMGHDSMGAARYGGRGQIFIRLYNHRERYKDELEYFSFYIIENKKHEREIETAIIRAAEPQMVLNERKRHFGIQPGKVTDYEAGTLFFERQEKPGRRKKVRRATRKRG